MKAPVVALKQPGNHGPHAGSICQKICPQRPKPGKYDYFAQPESYSRSGAWEFFTENCLGYHPRPNLGRFSGIGRCRSPEKPHMEADEVENLVLVARRDQVPKQPILLACISPHSLRLG